AILDPVDLGVERPEVGVAAVHPQRGPAERGADAVERIDEEVVLALADRSGAAHDRDLGAEFAERVRAVLARAAAGEDAGVDGEHVLARILRIDARDGAI